MLHFCSSDGQKNWKAYKIGNASGFNASYYPCVYYETWSITRLSCGWTCYKYVSCHHFAVKGIVFCHIVQFSNF